MKTTKSFQKTERKEHIFDAADQIIGRLATKAAVILQGKNKAIYTPNADLGDYVKVVNAAKMKVTGKKYQQKLYRHYSGYPGGLREVKLQELMTKDPSQALRHAIERMLPKNRLRKGMLKRLLIQN